MLKAGIFDEFKGATTLLVWGDGDGMGVLLGHLQTMRDGFGDEFVIDGPNCALVVSSVDDETDVSTLHLDGHRLCWACSLDTIELAADLVEPLALKEGHQFMDVRGFAEQVVIARDEYPADLR